MLITNKKIAIVGGGPGGLTLATLLQKSGADVKVYERDLNKDVRPPGGALDLHYDSGLAALEKAGLLDAFKANYRPGADKIRIVDSQANIHFDEYELQTSQDFGNENFRPEIDRGPLKDILMASLPPDMVVYDSHVTALEPVGQSWKLEFQNGQSATADIIIGADGAHSKIRPLITPIKPFWVGLTMLEGVVHHPEKSTPKILELLKGGKIFAFGNAKSLIVSSKGDGGMGFGTGCKTDEFWVRDSGIDFNDNAQVFNWFKQEFSEWDSIWYELFDNDDTQFIPRPVYCMPLDQTWEPRPNITILGDAAHWMPPYSGEGVNMAMLDALELSTCLTNDEFPDIQSAIAAYETQMRKRASEIAQEALDSTEALHAPDSLSFMLQMFDPESAD
ncbi:MAG: FAD-dependent monooxygenase [Anaerolineae bacterium]|nr:FAD-dependent monooxygenase [Anaerolineae bacterium]